MDGGDPLDASRDGRYVVFVSGDANIVADDTNNTSDVFVRDTVSDTTVRVSVRSDGGEANAASYAPRISGDGRYVVFGSSASNLVSGDTNGEPDVFRHDLQTGKTIRVSVTYKGRQANGDSGSADISDDGTRIVFVSSARNLVAARDRTPSYSEVYLRDVAAKRTVRVAVSSSGRQANEQVDGPIISGDGSTIAFQTGAGNLVRGDDNGQSDVFVVKVATGAVRIASRSAGGTASDGQSWADDLSRTGRYLLLETLATNLAPGDTNGTTDVYRKDLQRGGVVRVSVADDESQSSDSGTWGRISETGRYVTFTSQATDLVPGPDSFSTTDCFLRDITGKTTRRVSLTSGGGNPSGGAVYWCVVVAGGASAFFTSSATDIVPGDTNGVPDVFLRSSIS